MNRLKLGCFSDLWLNLLTSNIEDSFSLPWSNLICYSEALFASISMNDRQAPPPKVTANETDNWGFINCFLMSGQKKTNFQVNDSLHVFPSIIQVILSVNPILTEAFSLWLNSAVSWLSLASRQFIADHRGFSCLATCPLSIFTCSVHLAICCYLSHVRTEWFHLFPSNILKRLSYVLYIYFICVWDNTTSPSAQ